MSARSVKSGPASIRPAGRSRRSGAAAVLAAAVVALAAAPAAHADWLVLRDGSRVETRGAWKEKGRLVVFHTADGQLASLRLAEVDLAASREATAEAERQTAEAAERAAAEPEPPPRATRRITNADIPPGRPEPPAAAEAEPENAGAAAGTARRAASPVTVSTWDRSSAPGESLAFRGTLRNTAANVTAAAVELQVALTGRDGEPLATRAATVRPSTLPAGATATFEVTFDDLYDYGALRFEVDSVGLRQGAGSDDGGEEPDAGLEAATGEEPANGGP